MSNNEGQYNNSARLPAEHDSENYISYVIIGGVALIIFSIFMRYFAYIGIYVYAPLGFPVWLSGKMFGVMGSAGMMTLYMIICAIVTAVKFFKNKKISPVWASLTVLWLVYIILEFATGAKGSFYTGYMNYYCSPPKNSYWLALFECQNSPQSLMKASLLAIIGFCLLPNLVYAMPSLADLIGGFFRLSTQHPKSLSTQVHGIDSLIKSQMVIEPHLKVYNILNPNDEHIYKGQLRVLDGSRRFAYDRELVSGFVARNNTSGAYGFKPDDVTLDEMQDIEEYDIGGNDRVPIIDVEKFNNEMMKQLGSIWTGSANLSAAETIILSIALPRACCLNEDIDSDKDKAIKKDCERRINEVWEWVFINQSNKLKLKKKLKNGKKPSGKEIELASRNLDDFPHLEQYRAAIDAWTQHEIGEKIVKSHAYNRTIIFRALEDAKKLGVMAPTNFRWLKFYDREVWALVQNVSRPSGFAENIGTMSHYRAERRADKAIYKPKFQAAYNGLIERISEYHYSEREIELWQEYISTSDKEKKELLRDKLKELNMITSE